MVNRSVSTIVQCWNEWSVENRDRRVQGSGRPIRTADRQDRHLRLLAFRHRHMSTNSVGAAWYNILGPPQLSSSFSSTFDTGSWIGVVRESTEMRNGTRSSSRMNPDSVWGCTTDDRGSGTTGVMIWGQYVME
ncbi:hypothetical protein BDFB_008565, partial [Asbolus verrucosus]